MRRCQVWVLLSWWGWCCYCAIGWDVARGSMENQCWSSKGMRPEVFGRVRRWDVHWLGGHSFEDGKFLGAMYWESRVVEDLYFAC